MTAGGAGIPSQRVAAEDPTTLASPCCAVESVWWWEGDRRRLLACGTPYKLEHATDPEAWHLSCTPFPTEPCRRSGLLARGLPLPDSSRRRETPRAEPTVAVSLSFNPHASPVAGHVMCLLTCHRRQCFDSIATL